MQVQAEPCKSLVILSLKSQIWKILLKIILITALLSKISVVWHQLQLFLCVSVSICVFICLCVCECVEGGIIIISAGTLYSGVNCAACLLCGGIETLSCCVKLKLVEKFWQGCIIDDRREKERGTTS